DTGSIDSSASSQVLLQGTGTPTSTTTFGGSGGTFDVEGTLNNAGNNLTLDDQNVTFQMVGGTITGGTVTTTNGATLKATINNGDGGTLSGVTLDGTLDLRSYGFPNITITDGLTLNGTIDIGADDGST